MSEQGLPRELTQQRGGRGRGGFCPWRQHSGGTAQPEELKVEEPEKTPC